MRGVVAAALALLAGAGCASSPSRTVVPVTQAADLAGSGAPAAAPTAPAAPATPATAPAATPAPAPPVIPPALLLEPVTENQAFVTVDGTPRYRLGAGDVVEILLATGLTQERQTAVVKATGNVSAAFLEVKVAGLTPDQAAEAIRRELARYYRQIGVEVLVKEYNSKKVTVLGAVAGKVGALPLRGRMTLIDLFAEVGGPAPNADLERVRIIRQGGPPVTLNLLRLLDEPAAQAFALDAGDVVFIPGVGQPIGAPTAGPTTAAGVGGGVGEARVFVLGEVKTPGAVVFTPNMRLSQALTVAGGPTDYAVLESARVIRGGLQSPQIIEANFRALIQGGDFRQDLPLQPSDLIVLPRSGIGDWNAFIAKIKPTFELLTYPLTLPVQIKVLGQ